jgi:hypothetical protein
MQPFEPHGVPNKDAIPKAPKGGALSGVGTGGGKSEVETTHFLKDNEIGGALPDTQEGLDAASGAKHYKNEKAMEGSLTLVRGFPQINAGDKITILGVGPVFSGEWIVKTHTLKVLQDGCQSTLELTRNAVGKSGGESEASGGFETDRMKMENTPLQEDDYSEI